MSKIGKATIGLMIVTMLSKFLGFARELVLTYVYGIGPTADAYITSMSIPATLFTAIGAALATTFIPIFYEIDNTEGRKKSLEFTNNIFNILLVVSTALAIIGFIFAEPLVKIFAINFTGEKLNLAVNFTKIMIFGVVFIGLSNLMSAWLQINGKFSIAGMMTLPYNIFIIAGILISSGGNVKIMAIGTLIGISSQFFFQLPFAIKNNYKYKLYINIKDEYIKKMLFMVTPVFIGASVNQINTIIDRSLASTLGNGYITVLNSANRLNTFVLGLFIVTIATVIYPLLSKLSNENNKKKFVETVVTSINIVVLLIIPISIGAIILSKPVVEIVFQRGAFDSQATNMTSIALSCYAIGMIGFGLREVLDKIFYSLKDTKTPMINGSMAMITNIILNIILIKILGYVGLALATSISSLICTILLFKSLKNKIGYFGQDKIMVTFLKGLIAAILMGIITSITYNSLSSMMLNSFISEFIVLILSVAIGTITYSILLLLLKVEEIKIGMDIIRKKLKKS